MIAYFLLVHRYPDQFKRMFKAIYAPGNIYLIHIDKSSGSAMAEDIASFLAPYKGVEILPARRALWGGGTAWWTPNCGAWRGCSKWARTGPTTSISAGRIFR